MKKIQCMFLIMLALFIGGCTPVTEQVMPPLQYKQPVELHIAKNAYLNWEKGEQYSSTLPTHIPTNAGLLGVIVATAVDSEVRKNNPDRYTFTYGKAQQAVFMTSFKDILQQNEVFNQVELITDSQKPLQPRDVLITINFKKTRVSDEYDNYKITLVVDMIIKSSRKPVFKRTYLIESDPGGAFSGNSFKDQQTDVSQKLLSKLLAGIKQWHEQIN